jgi:hypothetical protein
VRGSEASEPLLLAPRSDLQPRRCTRPAQTHAHSGRVA